MPKINTIDDFLNRLVVVENDCWVYTGARNSKGYGEFMIKCKLWKTHRLSYEYHCEPIPEGMLVLHTCDNPPCCNPDHLFIGTNQDNMDDKVNKNRQARNYGITNSFAVLSEDQVNDIRNSSESSIDLAHKYKVSRWTITRARGRRTYNVSDV